MILGIMQPYFMPYIGYFQLLNAVDKYVLYDDAQYTKKGWMNRNRILQNGKDTLITIAVEKDSDYLDIRERFVASSFDKKKLLNQIRESYRKAPHFAAVMPLIEEIVNFEDNNLFAYIYNSIKRICKYLEINTEIIVSSTLNIEHSLKSVDRVLAICNKMEAKDYYNAIGGKELYFPADFEKESINLRFISSNPIVYKQFSNEFIPSLSIIDVIMFNSVDEIKVMLNNYTLVE